MPDQKRRRINAGHMAIIVGFVACIIIFLMGSK